MLETLRTENSLDGLDLILEPSREEVLESFLRDLAAADCKDQPAVIDLYEETYPAEMAWAFGEVE